VGRSSSKLFFFSKLLFNTNHYCAFFDVYTWEAILFYSFFTHISDNWRFVKDNSRWFDESLSNNTEKTFKRTMEARTRLSTGSHCRLTQRRLVHIIDWHIVDWFTSSTDTSSTGSHHRLTHRRLTHRRLTHRRLTHRRWVHIVDLVAYSVSLILLQKIFSQHLKSFIPNLI